MANVVVVGAQWGDEGKGKIVDWLSEQADIVVRFQGGHNAGHTLVINGVTYKLALLPSGVLRPSKLAVIGNGVVFDPQAFLDEVTRLKGQGVAVSPDNLRVAENVTLILPLHRELDALRESANALTAIGTTRRGIGPAYEDKVGRRAIRLMDLDDLDTLPHKIDRLLAHHNALRRGLESGGNRRRRHPEGAERAGAAAFALCRNGVAAARPEAPRGQAHPVRGRARRAARRRPRHLSLRHLVQHRGGAGGDRHRHGPGSVGYVLGICKAYTTRVGQGPFPTEQDNEIGRKIGERGREFGTNTGRPRRCGWFDAVLVRQTVRTCGIHGLALTKLDILDGFDTHRGLHRLYAGRQGNRPSAGRRGRAGPDQAGLRDHRGLEGADRQRPFLGGFAGPGHQICPPGRGIGGLPNRLAFHQPGTRRYYSGSEPVRGLTGCYRKACNVETIWLTTTR